MTNSEVCFRKILWAAVLREDPKGGRLKKGSPGEKRVGNKGSGDSNKERCESHLVREGGGRKGLGVRGEFHFTCAAFKVTSKPPGGNLPKKIERLGLRRNYLCCCWHQGPGNGQGCQRESVEEGEKRVSGMPR